MPATSSLLPFLRRVAIACLVVALLTGAGVWAGQSYERHAFDSSKKIHLDPGILTAVAPGHPANYLLIGSDSRSAVDTGSRSDVMMVLHVEPRTRTGYLVSFPRDLVVSIPGHGTQLLNAAYSLGGAHGPDLVIRTLEANFKPLTIQHYIEVDFKGFQDIVNAIGKVKLWFPTPVHDPFSGLNVDTPGCVALDGTGALAYARSRHYYVPRNLKHPAPWVWDYPHQRGGQGWFATGSDIDRIPRQQYFLRTISQAAIDKTASNPTKLFALLDAVKNNFTHDDTLKLGELQALIRTFNGLNPARVEMTTLPNAPATGQWAQHVITKYPDANPVISRLANFHLPTKLPATLPPRKVTVRVVNGSGVKGLAATVLSEFVAAGFRSAGPPADADRSDYPLTQLRYAPGKSAEGLTVAIAAGTTHFGEALSSDATLGGEVLVVVGRDWDKLTHHFGELGTSTTTRTRATNVPSLTSHTSSTARATTTTPKVTVDTRFFPVDPKTGGPLVGCPS